MPDTLRNAVLELRDRWKIACDSLGVSEIQLVDLVAVAKHDSDASPDYTTLRDRLFAYDMRFRAYPITCKLRSPYTTLIALLDHDCRLTTEHRIIDIWSPDGEMLGGVAGRIPWDADDGG